MVDTRGDEYLRRWFMARIGYGAAYEDAVPFMPLHETPFTFNDDDATLGENRHSRLRIKPASFSGVTP